LTDWLELCRAAVADVETVLERLPTRAEREPVVGEGRGGDETTAIDQAAEDAILARVHNAAGAVVSEEVGRVGGGVAGGGVLLVVDRSTAR
jgi:fructose-1,6-bisphosphatase/inositol monophosphatase family enzyme